MELPRLRFVESGGPIAPTPSISAATAPGRAAGAIGDALQSVGETGLRIAEQMRETKEAGIMSAWRSNADERANEFSNSLMSRQDPENWTQEWAAMREEIGAGLDGLGLSPVARQRARLEFDDWASGMGNRFSTQAAVRQVSEGKARWSNAVNYYASRGDDDGMRREIERGKGFIPESELEEVAREADRIRNRADVSRRVAESPAAALEEIESEGFLENNPGLTLYDQEVARREAQARIDEARNAEMDIIQDAFKAGTLHPRDIEAASYLTQRDREAFLKHMEANTPPTREQLAAQWERLAVLRQARGDAGLTPEQYRDLYYEAKAGVLEAISPRYAAELSKELNYLSPAGRAAMIEKGPDAPVTKEDLLGIGRSVISRARSTGKFGDIENGSEAEKERAWRRAEDAELELKRFLAATPDAGTAEIRAKADELITGDRTTTATRDFRAFIPGTGRAMLPPVRSTGRQQKADADAQLLEGDPGMSPDILPAKELEDFLTK